MSIESAEVKEKFANVTATPLVLKNIDFTKIFVEAENLSEADLIFAPTYDFEGTVILFKIDLGLLDRETNDTREALLRLQLAIPNEAGKKSPYKLDIHAQAILEVRPIVPQEERAKFLYVNGAGLVYASIRELVATLTARSSFGPLTLPTAYISPPEPSQEDLFKK